MKKNKNIHSKILNSSGLSLVEIVIGIGLLTFMGKHIVDLTFITQKSTTKFKQDSDVTLTMNEINSVLSDPKKCLLTFSETNFPTSVVSRFDEDNSTGKPVYTVAGQKYHTVDDGGENGYGASKLQILSYRLEEEESDNVFYVTFKNKRILSKRKKKPETPEGEETDPEAEATPEGEEEIEENPEEETAQIETFTRQIPMYVEWDKAEDPPKVVNCRSLSGSVSRIWKRGIGDDIYYRDGAVGIGIETPGAQLEVNGDIRSNKISAATFLYRSDKKLKDNIQAIENPIELLKQIEGFKFNWKKDGRADYGFIAQQIQESLPELVTKDKNRDILTVDYVKIIPILVEAMRKQEEQIKQLKEEIDDLEQQ